MIILKTSAQIESMRTGGRILAEILNTIGATAESGISTAKLDELARKLCEKYKVTPSFLGYRGFPASICTSVNTGVVHNVPSQDIILTDGDIIKIDFGVFHEGLHTDACQTFLIGNVTETTRQLVETTKQALYAGIAEARAGNQIGDISHAIEQTVKPPGYSPVRETVGHGIGQTVHEDPEVPNWGRPGRGPILRPGMTICIEPIINVGTEKILTERDGWTTRTADGALSAHFEHTLLITEGEPEILTPWDKSRT